jgi:stage III sporulation protein SpoIIIAA
LEVLKSKLWWLTSTNKITDDLKALLSIFALHQRNSGETNEGENLIEIVLDLGPARKPATPTGKVILSEREITQADLDYVIQRIGKFMGDNRAGIERTLHRISGILNRQGEVIGLTCRVGRLYLHSWCGSDILGRSKFAVMGRPGVKPPCQGGGRCWLKETVIIVEPPTKLPGMATSSSGHR